MSEEFDGKTTLARHRLVNERLKDEIAQLHAFSQVPLPSLPLSHRAGASTVVLDGGLMTSRAEDVHAEAVPSSGRIMNRNANPSPRPVGGRRANEGGC